MVDSTGRLVVPGCYVHLGHFVPSGAAVEDDADLTAGSGSFSASSTRLKPQSVA